MSNGKISTNTRDDGIINDIFEFNFMSEKVEPTSKNYPIRSSVKHIPVKAGDNLLVYVMVKTSANYTGTAPRLILNSNSALGYKKTILAEYNGPANTWIKLEGITTTNPTADGVAEVYVECSGEEGCGYININGWSTNL